MPSLHILGEGRTYSVRRDYHVKTNLHLHVETNEYRTFRWLHLLAGRKFALVLVRDQVVSTHRKYVTLNSDLTPKPSGLSSASEKAKASLGIFSGGREKTSILQEVHCLPQAVFNREFRWIKRN